MRRSYLIAIVVAGAAVIVFAIVFLILRNPYNVINPPPDEATSNAAPGAPPTADQATARELITTRTTSTLGAAVGVDGIRLTFLDLPTSTLRVAEYDGTGEQPLSDSFVGVSASLLSPTRDRALVQVDNPDSPDAITLVYDLRTRDSIRLEDGITAFDWSPDGKSVVYYVARSGAAPALKLVDAAGSTPQTLRSNFTLTEPVVDWYDATHVAFWQRPNSTRPSPIVSISTDGQESFELVAAGAAQQAIFSPDGSHVLVSFNDPTTGKPVLQLGDVAKRSFATLPLVTWVDKCTWAHDGSIALCFAPRVLPAGFTYPDDDKGQAYQDELWTVATSNGDLQRVYQVPDGVTDAAHPFASDDLARLNFLDRGKGSLVSLDLAGKVVPATTAANATTNNAAPVTSPSNAASSLNSTKPNATNNVTY